MWSHMPSISGGHENDMNRSPAIVVPCRRTQDIGQGRRVSHRPQVTQPVWPPCGRTGRAMMNMGKTRTPVTPLQRGQSRMGLILQQKVARLLPQGVRRTAAIQQILPPVGVFGHARNIREARLSIVSTTGNEKRSRTA